MNVTLKDIENAFFEAMQSGYAQSVVKGKIVELPGAKSICYVTHDNRFQVRDTWLVGHDGSDKSSGFTIIWNDGAPVWMMHYGGWYTELAISFLKSCLHKAYAEERVFYGGRGPTFVRDGAFTYVNDIEVNLFDKFKGSETVFNIDGQQFGYHWYRGGSLL